MKRSPVSNVSKTNNKGLSMKKSALVISDLVDNAPRVSSIAKQLTKADLYAEGFSAEEGESNQLLGVTTQMIDDVERFERYEREAKSFANRRALVQAYFTANKDLLPEGLGFTSESDVETLALFMESMKEDEFGSTGNNYVRNQGVTVILQGFSTKSGRWYNLTKSYEDKTLIKFSYDVESLCEMKDGFAADLKDRVIKTASFDLATKSTKYSNQSMPVVVADMLAQGYMLDGKMFRAVLISNAFNYLVGEVDSYKMVNVDGAWVREEVMIWDQGVELFPGVYALPATTDTSFARMELTQMESNIQVGASGLRSNAGQMLADQEEHFAILAEVEAMAKADARAKVRIHAKSIKNDNILNDNADATSIIEAIFFIAKTEGIAAASTVLEQYKSEALNLWKVLFPYSKQVNEILPSSLYATLKGYVAEARMNAKQDAFIEKCTDEAVGMILRLNAGERFEITGEQAVMLHDAALAGTKIENKSLYFSIRTAAIAHRQGFVA